MTNAKVILSFLLILNSCILGFGQLHYGISVNGGISNLNEMNHSYVYDSEGNRIKDHLAYHCVNFYTYNRAYSVEGFITETLKQSRYSLEQGLKLESVSYNFETPEVLFTNDTIHANSWKEQFWSVTIPLRVRYGFEKWMEFRIGLDNVFQVYENNEIVSYKPRFYQLRGEAGVDFILFNKLLLGATYEHDITPFSKLKDYNVSYRFDILSMKVGFRL